jgi:hypothetical protein
MLASQAYGRPRAFRKHMIRHPARARERARARESERASERASERERAREREREREREAGRKRERERERERKRETERQRGSRSPITLPNRRRRCSGCASTPSGRCSTAYGPPPATSSGAGLSHYCSAPLTSDDPPAQGVLVRRQAHNCLYGESTMSIGVSMISTLTNYSFDHTV